MRVLVEYEIKAGVENPRVKLDAERVAIVVATRIKNARLTVLKEFYGDDAGTPVRFTATAKSYTALTPIK